MRRGTGPLAQMAREARLAAARRAQPDLFDVECPNIVAREFA